MMRRRAHGCVGRLAAGAVAALVVFCACSLAFGQPKLAARITVPASPIGTYSLVRVNTDATAKYLDLLVMTVQGGAVQFVEVVPTINQGEWVFTGPPGEYSLRLTTFDAETGITTATGRVTIGVPPTPPPGPNPPNPPTPPTPPTPPPVPEGTFGFGPVCYTAAMQVPTPHRAKAAALADNFKQVANRLRDGDLATPSDAIREVAGMNNLTLSSPAESDAWKGWRAAWKAHADKLAADGKLTNKPDDYVTAFYETAAGLAAAK